MNLVNRFVLTLTSLALVLYGYLAWRLASGVVEHAALALPFVLIWLVPVVYWVEERESGSLGDELLHFAGYVCMGWLNFALLWSLGRDALQVASSWIAPALHAFLRDSGPGLVLAGSLFTLAAGALAALRGPHVRSIDVPIAGLAPALEGLRIVQITDLHIGPTIRASYVRRVVHMANELAPDLVALTGDLVDGPVERLAPHVAPLAALEPAGRVFFVPGNHEYYSGAPAWLAHYRALGLRVLLNEYEAVSLRGARIIVGGVLDAAARLLDGAQRPRPELAAGAQEQAALRLLLAHNPNIAAIAQPAGFDLQLSGHTHAGQFFPWTLAVHLVHAPHVAGLSRKGRMWVYVSAGTGTWGPPVRFGSEPELTLLRLVAAPTAAMRAES